MYIKIALSLALLSVWCGRSSCDEFLKAKPDFLQPCERRDADFSRCLANAYQHIFSTWKSGVPGVEGSKPIDPLLVPHFDVIEDSGNVTPITVRAQNVTALGLSEARVQNVSVKHNNEYSFRMSYFVPRVRLQGHYTALGQVLLLKIDTSGDLLMDILNGQYTVAVKIKLRQYKDLKFFDVKSLQFTVNSIETLHMNFSNLFKDDTLSENTNAIFNERWRTLFDFFKPRIEHEINGVLLEHFRNVFRAVPAHFFIADVANDN